MRAGPQQRLLRWWRNHGRVFPWRETKDPYRILVAEILLQRTRAEQVARVYGEFMKRFPSIRHLAGAEPGELRELFRPLGLHWRANLMLRMARRVVKKWNGAIPEDRRLLEELPGVSEYIASAVRCFAFGHTEPVLDTNTVRVASRFFGLKRGESSRRSNLFRSKLAEFVSGAPPAINWALIDLASLVCTPAKPACEVCPLRSSCAHARRGKGEEPPSRRGAQGDCNKEESLLGKKFLEQVPKFTTTYSC